MIDDITKLVPHRYPFLLIDRIVELVPGKRAVAIKNVSNNEWFFAGHFPGKPIMPGVLIVEALAQTVCVAERALNAGDGNLGVFTKIEEMKFKKQVVPGDTLRLEGEIIKFKLGIIKANVIATVDGEVIANGKVGFASVPLE